ncbi:MAG TPA: 3'-5' exonuclease [Leptospiraceae bacterium]|nr:3'-5' exonuclease [Leptospiraceae bacterium]HMY66833.1 3'-5' exonuclease [Leptospiraceae bacterium]HNF14497.1 3'-5' exonuclease [Leptospiraceae bacterium]HNF26444.1 3'-5' exonuclease [Leptospiraceae bacterium]HNN06212.1 3'-5' exonuclease [Leptospiraceae bacterium]
MLLNPEQTDAVRHTEGPLLIFAGAGSGKTRVITNRIVYLIRERKADPKKIAALSFTNKSAKEMRDRVRKLLGNKESKGIELSTFHSLALKICKEYIPLLGYQVPFLLCTPYELESILLEVLKSKKIEVSGSELSQILSRISFWKNSLKRNASGNEEGWDSIIPEIFEPYSQRLKRENILDFDDLILKSMEIMESFPEARENLQKKFQFFMVDEFQDTNMLQYKFLRLLLGENRNLCVVGDDDQSIYGFRGSDRDLILNFERDFPGTKTIKLLQNYRSCEPILKMANALIKNNQNRKEKELWSARKTGDLPLYTELGDEKEEASFVADKVQELILRHKKKGSEIAVLFRTNYQSRPFEEELRLRSIPYRLIGAYNFFDRKEVKDLIAYIRIIANSKDDLSFLRILNYPKRGLGETAREKIQNKSHHDGISISEVLLRICESPDYIPDLKKNAASSVYALMELISKYKKEFHSTLSLTHTLKNLVTEAGFEKEFFSEEKDAKVIKARMFNLSELINMLDYFEKEWEGETRPTLFDFLLRLALLTSDDGDSEKEDSRIQLMTMHLSKGLEFDAVFLCGLEEGFLPSARSMSETNDADEERRLFYVGITRAREKLFLSSCRNRKKFGESVPVQPSRFLSEIPEELMETAKTDDESAAFSFLENLESLKAV